VQNLINRKILKFEDVCAITRQLADALVYVHDQKRTHNDIKPENVLLCSSSCGGHLVAKLADFGLADHSVDRSRDYELFAYTIWCTGLGKTFTKVPSADERESAMSEFQTSNHPSNSTERQIWGTITETIAGIWETKVDLFVLAEMKALQDMKITASQEFKKKLEGDALKDLKRRSLARTATIMRDPLVRSNTGRLSVETGAGDSSQESEEGEESEIEDDESDNQAKKLSSK